MRAFPGDDRGPPHGTGRVAEENDALIRALLTESRPGIIVYGPDLTIHRASVSWGDLAGRRLADVLVAEDAAAVEERLRHVAGTGEPVSQWEHRVRTRDRPDDPRTHSLSAFRLTDAEGRPMGVVSLSRDITSLHHSRRRLEFLHKAFDGIGLSLEPSRTAEALVAVFVPDLADWAAVDLAAAVFDGGPLPGLHTDWSSHQRQTAVTRAGSGLDVDMGRRAQALEHPPDTERIRLLKAGHPLLTDDLASLTAGEGEEARFLRRVHPRGAGSVIVAPLYTRDGVLGTVSLARSAGEAPLDKDDVALVEQILPRAALNVYNAWRFAREHQAAVTLQRSLLPGSTVGRGAAVEISGSYVSAGAREGVGGDWYDVIPLSSYRVAFVVGDVVGHGLRATATMGRLRTAVQSFADLELDPEELLAHLDDLVQRLSADQGTGPGGSEGDTAGATCLYAVYDPVTCRCVVASAGHPPPALVRPDGVVGFVGLEPGPPLGVGGLPFEAAEFRLAPGSVLAFYTNGLVRWREQDFADGMEALRGRLGAAYRPAVPLPTLSRDLMSALLPAHPVDDATLLLARTRAVAARDTAAWELPADERAAGEARRLVVARLALWDLDELAFTAEMITSELVTNAVRHAEGPIGVRLIRGEVLVCEVSDASNTQPRMRRAHSTDEGGRGLFIVAQLAQRWGSRYGSSGKTIWAEIPTAPAPVVAE
jgi:GAF domain-containing protein/anti-sigma regulatory factor (Ser/Thr protein kinase)